MGRLREERKEIVGEGITEIILSAVGVGAVIGVALLFPGIGILYKEHQREEWERAKKRGVLRDAVKRLERQKLLSWQEDENGNVALTLTEKGKKKVLHYHIDNLNLVKDKKDGFLRVVVFDIPENMRDARDILREKLKTMGFFQWQRSVFVTPFECKNEIDFLRHSLGVEKYVQYILAKEVPGLIIS